VVAAVVLAISTVAIAANDDSKKKNPDARPHSDQGPALSGAVMYERHEYELYLAVEDIDHSRTKTSDGDRLRRSPATSA